MVGLGKGADSCKVMKAHLSFPAVESMVAGMVQLFREALNLTVFSTSTQKCQLANGLRVKLEQRWCKTPLTPLIGLCSLSWDRILSHHPVQCANRGPGHIYP